jgi:hypothetical protein
VVGYFVWRQPPFAQEQMHSRLNLPGRHEFSRGGREVAAAANDLMHLGDLPASAAGDVAIVYDYEAHWVTGIQPHGVARADQRAQNQRQEETHKARDLPNDVARAVAPLLVRQAFVCVEAPSRAAPSVTKNMRIEARTTVIRTLCMSSVLRGFERRDAEVADEAKVDAPMPAEIAGAQVDFRHLRTRRIELAILEAGPEHEQEIAAPHRVIADGPQKKQASPANAT